MNHVENRNIATIRKNLRTLNTLIWKLQEMHRFVSFSVLSPLEILKYPHVLTMLLLPYYLKWPEVPCYSHAHHITRSNIIHKASHMRPHFIKYPKHIISTHNRYVEDLGLWVLFFFFWQYGRTVVSDLIWNLRILRNNFY